LYPSKAVSGSGVGHMLITPHHMTPGHLEVLETQHLVIQRQELQQHAFSLGCTRQWVLCLLSYKGYHSVCCKQATRAAIIIIIIFYEGMNY
jgi:hypothetical protein